jgi:hypothetical protein
MKRAISFVLLLTSGIISFSQNLVINPGFETWGKVTKPTSWNSAINCSKDSVEIKTGKYSCKHYSTIKETKSLAQMITVLPDKKYRLSFYYKTIIVNNDHGCRIWCDWKDASGASIADSAAKLVLQPSSYLKSDIWQQFTVDISSPAHAASFNLEVRTYQNTVSYFDDFVFAENIATSYTDEKFSGIIIYPNPAQDFLTINKLENLQHIDIHNIAGISIWSSKYSGEESVTIPISSFPDGAYIIGIRTSNKTIFRKFIKRTN